MKIAVVGSGAQGTAIAADLTRADLDVTVFEQWPEHVEAIRTRGAEVRFETQTVTTPLRIHHFVDIASYRHVFDIVFLAVKAYDTRWVCELIKPLVHADGAVVGLQNGMTVDAVADVLGKHRAVGAVIEISSNMFEPGIVNRQTGIEDSWFAVGTLDESISPRIHDVADVLRHAGRVEVTADVRSSKWMKLVANAGELIPAAILNVPLVEASQIPGIYEFMLQCGTEAVQAALATGSRLVPIFGMTARDLDNPNQYAKILLDTVLKEFALDNTLTTSLQDWIKGRRAEVDDVNGLVVRTLEALGKPAPANRRAVAVAALIEARTLRPDPANAVLLIH